MAINPLDKVFLSDDNDATGKQKLETLAAGGSITSGSDTYTADETAIYLTADTSVLFEEQTLTVAQKSQARTNIGAGTSDFDGNYSSLSGAPAIPSKTSDLTNDGDGTSNFATLSDLPTVPSNVSAFNNDSGYITAESDPVFSSSPAAGISSGNISSWDNKVDKTSTANKLYGTNGSGEQTTYDVANASNVGGAVAKYDASGRLKTATPSASDDATNKNYVDSAISNPNLLINGDFRINQRGGANYTTARKYTADRWINREASLKVTPSSSGGVTLTIVNSITDLAMISQSIEDYEPLLGKTVTLSMKLKSNNITGGVELALYQANNAYYATSKIGGQLFEGTGLCSVTMQIPSSLSYSLLNVVIRFNTDAIVNEACEIEYVKLEIGSIATPFSPRPYAEELSMCQRYYIKPISGTYQYVASGSCFSATRAVFALATPTTMRANPTVTRTNIYALITNSAKALSSLSASVRPNCLQLIGDFTGGTAGYAAILASDSSSAELSFDAEIY